MSAFLPRVIYLVLKGEWYDMIDSGEKPEEYRDLKRFWETRLMIADDFDRLPEIVEFRHGYKKDARKMRFNIEDISIGTGNSKWGAEPGKEYFVIKLGERISIWKP